MGSWTEGGRLSPVKGYTILKVYVIICDKCNEDITRAQTGDEPETRADAEDYAREHDAIWHPAPAALQAQG